MRTWHVHYANNPLSGCVISGEAKGFKVGVKWWGLGISRGVFLVKVWGPLINFGILLSNLCILVHLEGYTAPQNMNQ